MMMMIVLRDEESTLAALIFIIRVCECCCFSSVWVCLYTYPTSACDSVRFIYSEAADCDRAS